MNWFSRRPDAPPPAIPRSPPTAEDTKRAVNHLRVSDALYDDALKSSNLLGGVAKASAELMKARALDPSATLTSPRGLETIDMMAARYLYFESRLSYVRAEDMLENKPEVIRRETIVSERHFNQLRRKAFENALAPAQRAVNYHPQNVGYLRHLALIQKALGNTSQARLTIEKALALSPDDIETLKVSNTL